MPTALYNPVPTFIDWFEQRGINVVYNSDCTGITDEGVLLTNVKTGEQSVLQADTVIIASGITARTEEAYSFQNAAPYFALAGDCVRPKKIRDAIFTAYWNTMEI